jgi:hypothetical protein
MPNEDLAPSGPSGPEMNELLAELEVPFPPCQVQWRVTNTTNDKKRGQTMPYADPRAYTDRLNALFSPQGWTRTYKIETLNNITRLKKGESIVTGKVLVTCTVTIIGLGSHSGTGEEWADDDNGMTSADAQAFKRACSCFGLGRYFYDFTAPWVDLDQNRQPLKTPTLPAWAIPENWRKGMRPPGKNNNGTVPAKGSRSGNGVASGNCGGANGNGGRGRENATGNGNGGPDLDARILGMEKVVGTNLYRNVLREHGRANQPKLIRDITAKRKVLEVLESATRGLDRLNAITKWLDPSTVETLLTKLQAPPVREIADMKTLQAVVFGLEDLAAPQDQPTR